MSNGKDCLVLNVSSVTVRYLSVSSCNESYYGIYSRVKNATDVLQQRYFRDILEEITIDTTKTGKVLRSRTSATNHDGVAKALGGTVGMVFVLVTFAVILFIDLPRTAACCHGNTTARTTVDARDKATTAWRPRQRSRSKL